MATAARAHTRARTAGAARSRAAVAAPPVLGSPIDRRSGAGVALASTTPAALALGVASALVVGTKPDTHAFTLADCRYYTFYVWSKVFRRPRVGALAWAALVPAAAYAAFLVHALVRGRAYHHAHARRGKAAEAAGKAGAGRGVTPLWWLGFVLATALVLVPARRQRRRQCWRSSSTAFGL